MTDAANVNTPLFSNLRLVTEDSLDRGVADNSGRPSWDHSGEERAQTRLEGQAPRGTFMSSVFMTLNSAVGTGVLTLPFAFRCAGLYGGVAALLGFMGVEYLTLLAIIRCVEASDASSYSDVVRAYLGRKTGTLMSLVIAFYCFFACTAAFIIVKNVASPILLLASGGVPAWWTSSFFQLGVAGAFAFPLLCFRSITSLQFTAMLSFVAIMFVAGVVVSQYFTADFPTPKSGKLDDWGTWPSALLAVPNIFLSLQCHIQVRTCP
jgi:amino acid permease